jgi:hypothetical protein
MESVTPYSFKLSQSISATFQIPNLYEHHRAFSCTPARQQDGLIKHGSFLVDYDVSLDDFVYEKWFCPVDKKHLIGVHPLNKSEIDSIWVPNGYGKGPQWDEPCYGEIRWLGWRQLHAIEARVIEHEKVRMSLLHEMSRKKG